jgi:hypothetical protein
MPPYLNHDSAAAPFGRHGGSSNSKIYYYSEVKSNPTYPTEITKKLKIYRQMRLPDSGI